MKKVVSKGNRVQAGRGIDKKANSSIRAAILHNRPANAKKSDWGRTDEANCSRMHATKKEGREEDRKERSMFVSSCAAEHATVALWNKMRFFKTNFSASHYYLPLFFFFLSWTRDSTPCRVGR